MKLLVLCLAAAGVAAAQIGYPGGYPPVGYPGGYPPGTPYPGGSPYPGGTPYPGGAPYPGGQAPGTGTGVPAPKGKKSKDKNKDQAPLPNFRGKLKEMDSKTIRLELDDYRVMEFRVTGKTKFTKNGQELKSPKFNTDFNQGDQVSVEASEELDASMTAVNVYWEKSASASADKKDQNKDGVVDTWKDAPKDAPRDAKTQSAAPDPADPGPPELKRGRPKDVADDRPLIPIPSQPESAQPTPSPKSAAQPAPRETASNVPLPSVDLPPAESPTRERPEDQLPTRPQQQDRLIQRAAEAALEFTETLPDYVCEEMMARAESQSRPANWRPLDVVTMEVVYDKGKENYRKVAINGKATTKPLSEIGGAYSTGEFGTMLIDLFSPASAAEFNARGESRIAGVTAKTYGFTVKRENSHWDLHFGPQTFSPAYSGTVWIDPSTGRVLRIEMQAQDLPKDFPADHVESATDYQNVRLGGTHEFLLPVHSETLSCQRGSDFCSRNTIDFRNYHKYTGESTVEFGTVK